MFSQKLEQKDKENWKEKKVKRPNIQIIGILE